MIMLITTFHRVFHLVDTESDGQELVLVLARDFLHQTDQDGAAGNSVVRLVVHVLQKDEEVVAGAEGSCRQMTGGFIQRVPHAFNESRMKRREAQKTPQSLEH